MEYLRSAGCNQGSDGAVGIVLGAGMSKVIASDSSHIATGSYGPEPVRNKEGPVATYEMSCSCGDKMQAEGDTKEAAVDNLMTHMTPDAVQAHMTEKHAGQTPPSPEQVREGMLASAHVV